MLKNDITLGAVVRPAFAHGKTGTVVAVSWIRRLKKSSTGGEVEETWVVEVEFPRQSGNGHYTRRFKLEDLEPLEVTEDALVPVTAPVPAPAPTHTYTLADAARLLCATLASVGVVKIPDSAYVAGRILARLKEGGHMPVWFWKLVTLAETDQGVQVHHLTWDWMLIHAKELEIAKGPHGDFWFIYVPSEIALEFAHVSDPSIQRGDLHRWGAVWKALTTLTPLTPLTTQQEQQQEHARSGE